MTQRKIDALLNRGVDCSMKTINQAYIIVSFMYLWPIGRRHSMTKWSFRCNIMGPKNDVFFLYQ